MHHGEQVRALTRLQVALVGGAPVILLDEPSTGMDPGVLRSRGHLDLPLMLCPNLLVGAASQLCSGHSCSAVLPPKLPLLLSQAPCQPSWSATA